jgi:bile acid:Na+ symporter, BASS family
MGGSLQVLDGVRLNFSPGGLVFMNITLALVMFGVALEIDLRNFMKVLSRPKPVFVGLFAQYIILPFTTFLLVMLIHPTPSVALGMILVASCPSGNIANFLTLLSKGNVELSITLNAIATILAVFLTPLNFAFYGNMFASHIMMPISIDPEQMVQTVFLLLGLPLILGAFFTWAFPVLAHKIMKPMKVISLVAFMAFVVAALGANFDHFLKYIYLIIFIVLIHNAMVISAGFLLAKLTKLETMNIKTITIESGIHNSGLALVLIFNPKIFNGLGGMAFVAAWWGIWHIISGLALAAFFRKRVSL